MTKGGPVNAGIAVGPLDQRGLGYLQRRGLSRRTLELFNVGSATPFFPDLGRTAPAIVFPYPKGVKARAIDEKAFVCGNGFKAAFFNLDHVLRAGPDTAYITEGEIDALSLVEAGIPQCQVLSVPNGARERAADTPFDLRGYGYANEALAQGLSRVRRFVMVTDGDLPGSALRQDLVRVLGPARSFFVDWPEGLKDANHALTTDGADFLRALVTEGALPWPVSGLYRLSELPDPGPLTLWKPGFAEWESKVMLAPRTVSVVTGHPNHGKTTLWNQIWFQVARDYGVPICAASFETRPKPHLRRQLRSLHTGKLERELTANEIAAADRWIDQAYLFAEHPDQRPDLKWLLDTAEVAVIRHGARVLWLDPWNRMEGSRGSSESETDYIGRCLRGIYAFANDLNCHVQVSAHPAKMEHQRRGKPPDLEDISGSKHWDNMVDQGFAVHRPEMFDGHNRKTGAVLYHRKARFEELGYPCRLGLNYDLTTGRYVSTDYQ